MPDIQDIDIDIDMIVNDIYDHTINENYLLDKLNYFNTSPTIDVDYYPRSIKLCDKHKHKTVCYKCLLDHNEEHKCYVYDRIFIALYMCEYYYHFNDYNLQRVCEDRYMHWDDGWTHSQPPNGRYYYIMFDGGCAGSITNEFSIRNRVFKKCYYCEYCE